MIVGLFLDGWAHNERRPDSFFTPWHGVLYSGFLGSSASALWQIAARRRPGMSWRQAVPHELIPSLAGLGVFALGGVGDLGWHQLFGIEANLAALLSPTHLLLMTGALLALTGPLRTAWYSSTDEPTLRSFLPALISLTLSTTVALFFTLYLSPFGRTVAARFPPSTTDIHDFSAESPAAFVQLREMWAVGGILFTTALLFVPVLIALRRWHPPRGSLFIYFASVAVFEAAASEFRRWPLALAVVAVGAVAELLAPRASIRLTAGALPPVLWLAYFGTVAAIYGRIGWSAELWTGTIVLSSLTGLCLGLLGDPPARGSRDARRVSRTVGGATAERGSDSVAPGLSKR